MTSTVGSWKDKQTVTASHQEMRRCCSRGGLLIIAAWVRTTVLMRKSLGLRTIRIRTDSRSSCGIAKIFMAVPEFGRLALQWLMAHHAGACTKPHPFAMDIDPSGRMNHACSSWHVSRKCKSVFVQSFSGMSQSVVRYPRTLLRGQCLLRRDVMLGATTRAWRSYACL